MRSANLIRGGTIYPGGDVAIRGGRIIYVGKRAPDFIDTHTHVGDALASDER